MRILNFFLKETLTIAVSQNSSCFEAVIQEEKNEKDMENIFIAKDNVLLSEDPPDPPENASKVYMKIMIIYIPNPDHIKAVNT